ncbi:hypothetical protein BKA82DRAFT_20812 [Pisolithus tinctorius]|uniref:Uncharacterized protein n=1 Tax=Pisolithus tinctorius Marx 270 TaxID=870435 RepID=A0A0C3PCA0_PISTI|nr:hypothetical protein BKA82DRAFT_20812 [Pisolithus tinctorius]KIO11365.1 hypothetical protein M404DRAFT_20812 [Pisolithus tinctorius Marx 270]
MTPSGHSQHGLGPQRNTSGDAQPGLHSSTQMTPLGHSQHSLPSIHSRLDDPFTSRPAAQRRDHDGPSLFSPEFSFPHQLHDTMDPTSPIDSLVPQEGSSYDYQGRAARAPVTICPSHMPVHLPMVSQLVKGEVKLLWKIVRVLCTQHPAPKLTANLKRLSEANTNLEDELTNIREENKSIVSRLNDVEEVLAELRSKVIGHKGATKTCSNNHVALKSILQPLFCQLCGIDCDGKKQNRVAALTAIRPLDNKQAFEETNEGVQIWHPYWLGNIDDEVNARFIREVAECAFNNEKSQREQTKMNSIPDTSFTLPIILECAKTYFRSVCKRAKELHSDQGTRKFEARLEHSRQRARRITVAAAQRKAALQYEKETGNEGAEVLINTDLGSDIITCNENESANKVVGHAWRSVDYVAFLRWLSLRAMKLQQDMPDEPNQGSMDQGLPCKRHRITKKIHKWVFDIAPKHMNRGPPLSKTTIFKPMVDERWYKENVDTPVIEGIDWLKGFYSRLNEGDLFEADAIYLKELDEYLKTEMLGQSLDEEFAD